MELSYEEVVASYKETHVVNDEMTCARNSPNEFFRILRKSYKGQNANFETYGYRKNYNDVDVTVEYQEELIRKLRTDEEFRYKPKNDRDKTNITDAPGFGSVRLVQPFEDLSFDKEYFEFLNKLCERDDKVYDYGGGLSPFIFFIDWGDRILVDKADVPDITEPLGVKYIDAEDFITQMKEKKLLDSLDPETKAKYIKEDRFPGILFCFHTIEHTNNPEELIELFSKFDVFVFATPNEETIGTSKYHHILMQVDVLQKLFEKNKTIAFLRKSKYNNLDIHGIVVNSIKKWRMIKDNQFFNNNFKFYKEM